MRKRYGWFVAALVACVLASGCVWLMDVEPEWELTFRGQVSGAAGAAPVAGAWVEIWVNPPEPVGNVPSFVQGETNAQGEFALTRSLRSAGVSPEVIVRITPPAGSGLQAGSFEGHASQVFEVEYSNRRYTYTGDFPLQAGASE